MNQEELDTIADLLDCEKVVRDSGAIAYVLKGYANSGIVMTQKIKRLAKYIIYQKQVQRTEGFIEANGR